MKEKKNALIVMWEFCEREEKKTTKRATNNRTDTFIEWHFKGTHHSYHGFYVRRTLIERVFISKFV